MLYWTGLRFNGAKKKKRAQGSGVLISFWSSCKLNGAESSKHLDVLVNWPWILFNILHKHCLHFLLGDKMAPRETENNAWCDKRRALWYVMVFSGVVNSIGSLFSSWSTGRSNVLVYANANKQKSGYCLRSFSISNMFVACEDRCLTRA